MRDVVTWLKAFPHSTFFLSDTVYPNTVYTICVQVLPPGNLDCPECKGVYTVVDDERIYCTADEHYGVGRKDAFCTIAQNAFFLLYYSDERFSAGDERVESTHSNFHPTQLHILLPAISKQSFPRNCYSQGLTFKNGR